jgi:hypothetical protein
MLYSIMASRAANAIKPTLYEPATVCVCGAEAAAEDDDVASALAPEGDAAAAAALASAAELGLAVRKK